MDSAACKVIIVHGTKSTPEDNWFGYLAKELESEGFEVSIPRFPTPEQQSLENWRKLWEESVAPLSAQDVLIGHSLGAAFILRLLESLDVKLKAVALVSGFAEPLGDEEFDALNQSFLEEEFNWEKINQAAEKFLIYAGDDDPHVPLEFSEDLAMRLKSPIEVIIDGGHLNSESGFEEFPELKEDLLSLLSKG